MQPTPPPGVAFVVWLIVLVAIGFLVMLLFKAAVWWGEHMSSEGDDETVRAGSRTGALGSFVDFHEVVRWHQNHVEPQELRENDPPAEPALRQLGKDELIVLLAVQRNDEGGYRYSANQITAFVGGAAAPVKATIAAVRGTPKPAPNAPLKRPANGW